MLKAKIFKLLLSEALLMPFIPAAGLEESVSAEETNLSADAAGSNGELTDEQLNTGADFAEDSDPVRMPDAPLWHGTAGVAWAVSKEKILYIQAGQLEKTDFDELFDVRSIREVRVVPAEDCSKLILPANCWGLFWNFRSLTKIDTGSFDTSQVEDMSAMFGLCSSLKSLDLSGFNTWRVEDMSGMFLECSSLVSLDLSNFNTCRVTDMRHMFQDCSSLEFLNISGFDTGRVKKVTCMYEGCTNLEMVIDSDLSIDWSKAKGLEEEELPE